MRVQSPWASELVALRTLVRVNPLGTYKRSIRVSQKVKGLSITEI